jgi:hypothetical protein
MLTRAGQGLPVAQPQFDALERPQSTSSCGLLLEQYFDPVTVVAHVRAHHVRDKGRP